MVRATSQTVVAAAVRIQGEEFKVRARIRSIDLYSGHADGPELADWIEKRLPIHHNIFLVHGKVPALSGLQARLNGIVDAAKIILPAIDEMFELTATGSHLIEPSVPPRINREKVAQLDWHNKASRLMLDINDALTVAADEKARAVVIRRLR
jgi:metallo-beta-lactamase family protein